MPVSKYTPSKERAGEIVTSPQFLSFYKEAREFDPDGSPGGAARWAFIRVMGWDRGGALSWGDRYAVPGLSDAQKNTLNYVQSQFANDYNPLEIESVTAGDLSRWSAEAIADNPFFKLGLKLGRYLPYITLAGAGVYAYAKLKKT